MDLVAALQTKQLDQSIHQSVSRHAANVEGQDRFSTDGMHSPGPKLSSLVAPSGSVLFSFLKSSSFEQLPPAAATADEIKLMLSGT